MSSSVQFHIINTVRKMADAKFARARTWPDGWILYWKTPEPATPLRKQQVDGIIQLPLFELTPLAQAIGAEKEIGARRFHPHLHPMKLQPIREDPEE